METALLVLGVLIILFASVAFVIHAFSESALWGLAVIFVPLASLVFAIMHWREVKGSILATIVGVLMLMGSAALAPPQDDEGAYDETAVEAAD